MLVNKLAILLSMSGLCYYQLLLEIVQKTLRFSEFPIRSSGDYRVVSLGSATCISDELR